jgi:DNA-binding winged helix-turn-helix (wHTH) protein
MLDAHKECPTYIKTIYRKGYRMLLPTVTKSVSSIWLFPVEQVAMVKYVVKLKTQVTITTK